ncbi:MAG TPA: 1,2-phenylacetyl-CoA epoxidase subunit PaaC [Aromatoleum sp.]|uniref:1,2-phenylacetyl-CoA epoxidase subunit PaaC n=1 Tax=Aromatoleum sp. TaxID=2307007 RepID=UPI002B4A29CF|nr:1,2-phenylacetyl-CoA epoxidase subunit PaaC [Aromatoleum sp.]HJV25879.1 1,2-phenylacetyl-CoA epoxidase subunit PaaC [Aromatoleum sp.]
MLLDDKFIYLLRMGDNALVLSQRLSEWCGKGPAFEEDMALTNTALDLIGQARMWLSYAGEVEGRGRDEDALAFCRDAHDFTNLLLVEQPNGDYADTLVRQFFFDVWHHLTLDALTRSADDRIADIASKAIKEVAYHLRRSSDLVVRLGDGTAESRRRVQDAIDELWMFTGEMFKADETEELLAAQGLACDPASLKDAWLAMVGEVFDEATLTVPAGEWMQKGGKQGRHGEHLGLLLAEMQFLQRAYPNASW